MNNTNNKININISINNNTYNNNDNTNTNTRASASKIPFHFFQYMIGRRCRSRDVFFVIGWSFCNEIGLITRGRGRGWRRERVRRWRRSKRVVKLLHFRIAFEKRVGVVVVEKAAKKSDLLVGQVDIRWRCRCWVFVVTNEKKIDLKIIINLGINIPFICAVAFFICNYIICLSWISQTENYKVSYMKMFSNIANKNQETIFLCC